MKRSALLFSVVFLMFTAIIPGFIPASAQELSLKVDPPIMQIAAEAPTSIKAPLSIENTSDNPIDLSIMLKPFHSSSQKNGQIQFLEGNQTIGEDPNIFDKMQIYDGTSSIDSLTLAPRQKKDLILHIGLPKDEPPSDYYFTILFISKNPELTNQTGETTQGGIGINVLLSIGPTGNATGLLNQFSAPWLIEEGPVHFTILVENTSNFFIVPRGNIIIKNLFGQIVGKVQLLPVNILSRSQRFLPDDSSGSLTTAVWPEKVLFGLYQATITVALSSQGPLFTRSIYFFAMPIQAIIGIVITCIIAAFVYVRLKEKLKEK